MGSAQSSLQKVFATELTETLVRFALIALLAVMCVRIFAPFAGLVLWGLVLAIALQPLHDRLARRLGGRKSWASVLIVLVGLAILGLPTVLLGNSFASHLHDAYVAVENHTLTVPPPDPSVAQWPMVGDRVYAAWSAASTNLEAFVRENQALLRNLSRQAFGAAVSTAGAVLMFLFSIVVAGIMMAYAERGANAARRIISRLSDTTRGPRLQALAVATIRSVAAGVIGVAFIQAILLGMGFLLAGVPGAGILALVTMFIGILQLPALLVSLPVVAWLWAAGDGSTTSNVIWSVYLVIAGMADNVLKPLLLGRGVDAPMLVILIGALGGMVAGGIIGLFLGGVLLAVSYQLFMEWVDTPEPEAAERAPAPDAPVTGSS